MKHRITDILELALDNVNLQIELETHKKSPSLSILIELNKVKNIIQTDLIKELKNREQLLLSQM